MMGQITAETATDIAVLYRDIEAAEALLDSVRKAIADSEKADIRDTFGRRRRTLEMGIPTSDNSRRILHVPNELAIPVIEATIADHRVKLSALNAKVRAEIASESD